MAEPTIRRQRRGGRNPREEPDALTGTSGSVRGAPGNRRPYRERKLLQGHLEQRSPGEAAGPVTGADGVERSQRRVHERRIETTFGTVAVERVGYARPGHDSLHPLDAALNLPPERYSLEVRRRVAEAASSRSFDEALFDLSRSTGAEVPKRQAEQLVARAAEDFDAFYEARRAATGEPPPEGSVVVLTEVDPAMRSSA